MACGRCRSRCCPGTRVVRIDAEPERRRAEPDHVAIAQGDLADRLLIDRGAVFGFEIAQHPTPALEGQGEMLLGHAIVRDLQFTTVSGAEGGALVIDLEALTLERALQELNGWHREKSAE